MDKPTKNRIEIHNQLSCFYSIVFSGEHKFTPQHISLYCFLLNQNNRSFWVEWFKLPFDLAMAGSGLSSKKTYYKCLTDLQTWNLIKYERGQNHWKAPKISIKPLNIKLVPQLVPQSEPTEVPKETSIHIPIGSSILTSIGVRNIILITNILITNNIDTINVKSFNKDFTVLFQLLDGGEKQGSKKEFPSGDEKPPKELFPEYQDFINTYCDFYKSQTGINPEIKSMDGAALKKIIKYFRKEAKGDHKPIDGFRYIFANWSELEVFHQQQINLTQIYSNINIIILQLRKKPKKNGSATSTSNESYGADFKEKIDNRVDQIYGNKK